MGIKMKKILRLPITFMDGFVGLVVHAQRGFSRHPSTFKPKKSTSENDEGERWVVLTYATANGHWFLA